MKDKFNSPVASDKVKELKDVLKGGKTSAHVETSAASEPVDDASKTGEDVKSIRKKLENAEKELAKVEAELKEAGEQVRHHKEEYLRTLAEFENFRKRLGREKEDLLKYGVQKFVKDFLPVYDHLEMSIDHAEENESNKALVDGVRLVLKEFTSSLEKMGITLIAETGVVFDPHRHEAIGSVESSDHKPGVVVQIHRKGFMIYDRLIRPAMVTVSREVSLH